MATQHMHFLGIAGHAMRGIALAAQQLGYSVSGTDEGAVPPGSDWLDAQHLTWWSRPDPKHLEGVDKLIVSGGSPPDHPEIVAARQRQIPILSFAQLLDELLQAEQRLVISGTHGKTTTAALVAWILESAGFSPSFVIGAPTANFSSTTHLVTSKYAVIEGDEYRASQLDTNSKLFYYHPDYLLITSVEMDHPDFFKNLDAVVAKFSEVANAMKPTQVIVYNALDSLAAKVAQASPARAVSYGSGADYFASNVSFNDEGIKLSISATGQELGPLQVGLYGQHNVANTLGAVALARELGVSEEAIKKALASFKGTYRRFSITNSKQGFRVIDDYAHHPTAIATNIEAVRRHFGGKCIAVLQPHTFSRTRALAAGFAQALKGADRAYVLDIEAARENNQASSFSSAQLADGKTVFYQPDAHQLVQDIAARADSDTTVLVMSVSNQDELIQNLQDIKQKRSVSEV